MNEREPRLTRLAPDPKSDEIQQKYVKTLRDNCLRFLKATSPELLRLYKPYLSEHGLFLDLETGKETTMSPSGLISEPDVYDKILRSTNLELGLPEYFGRKDEKVAKKQGLE